MKILLLDNYDSFVYNIAHILRALGYAPEVIRNDKIAVEDAARFDKIILSPGPGIPEEAGIMPQLLKRYASEKPILGVCLGHQAIGEAFGARLANLRRPYHGVALRARICADDPIFSGMPREFLVGRYHSWIVAPESFPDNLAVTATDDEGNIMALRHKRFDVCGVQFHPESVLTEGGARIFKNWIEL